MRLKCTNKVLKSNTWGCNSDKCLLYLTGNGCLSTCKSHVMGSFHLRTIPVVWKSSQAHSLQLQLQFALPQPFALLQPSPFRQPFPLAQPRCYKPKETTMLVPAYYRSLPLCWAKYGWWLSAGLQLPTHNIAEKRKQMGFIFLLDSRKYQDFGFRMISICCRTCAWSFASSSAIWAFSRSSWR